MERPAPERVPRYAGELRRLACGLRHVEDREPIQVWMTGWLLEAFGLRRPVPLGDGLQPRWDAVSDIVGDAGALARFLERAADRTEARAADARLNLLSLLKAKVLWRERDLLRAHRAAEARCAEGPGEASRDAQSRYLASLIVERVRAEFGEPAPNDAVLARLLAGESISEVARATQMSRQAIYRLLERIRRWLERDSGPDGGA